MDPIERSGGKRCFRPDSVYNPSDQVSRAINLPPYFNFSLSFPFPSVRPSVCLPENRAFEAAAHFSFQIPPSASASASSGENVKMTAGRASRSRFFSRSFYRSLSPSTPPPLDPSIFRKSQTEEEERFPVVSSVERKRYSSILSHIKDKNRRIK